MTEPISNPDILHQLIQSTKLKDKPSLAPQSFDADEAAAQCLALLTDPDGIVLPSEAFRELAKRNAALLTAPDSEIKASLARQVVLLEAAATRFLSKAAMTANTDHSCALMKISLSAQRSLVATLGALHQMNEKDVHAIDA
ncbi:MAG: hypothetical protein IPK44_09075 [Candidatus Accumulibacter sp.]|jgi:hypothetical protein|uniref:hypothetical protein n=1 Tax=Accumulibacter sp. TaxID=2053492 RepID=UPI00258BF6C7|nr:hypothetical protein [Accumulibacter sp.]MBK8114661.1 hypothetical protein [Accumulibacter sp.]